MVKLIYHWGPVVAYCAAIFVQSSFPTHEQLPSFAFSDKLLHVIAYAILGALVCRGAKTINGWRHRRGVLLFIGTCAAALYGLSDEWHQSFVVGRSAEWADALADFVGSLVGSWLYVRNIEQGTACSL
jgi:VanZ family protein